MIKITKTINQPNIKTYNYLNISEFKFFIEKLKYVLN